jgi:hypothetical protein
MPVLEVEAVMAMTAVVAGDAEALSVVAFQRAVAGHSSEAAC